MMSDADRFFRVETQRFDREHRSSQRKHSEDRLLTNPFQQPFSTRRNRHGFRNNQGRH